MAQESIMITLSQSVPSDTKKKLDSIYHALGEYASLKGLRPPKKGEVLSKLVEIGAAGLDIKDYFKS